MATYKDVRIKDDDLNLDGDGQAAIIYDIDVIAQDLIHAIRESGYLVEMVAERSPERRELLLQKIILLVEDDERIIPGTVEITASPDNFIGSAGKWTLAAKTYEFGGTGSIELTAS
ncbi:MAG: DUF2590 family protein [Victivallaceae bacterium]|nr:DUF2590 family protein [Victivallaceae bacterium]